MSHFSFLGKLFSNSLTVDAYFFPSDGYLNMLTVGRTNHSMNDS